MIPITEQGHNLHQIEDKLPTKNPKVPSPHPTVPQSRHQTLHSLNLFQRCTTHCPRPLKPALNLPTSQFSQERRVISRLSSSRSSSKMAGLSVLLETRKNSTEYTHIISKTSLIKGSSPISASSSSSFSKSSFLERCDLCQKKLQEGKDIFMYRGDRAFCSVECRCQQMLMDEERGRREHCSVAVTAAAGEQATAGGFAY